MDEALDDLNDKLGRVLAKQEYDYMKCYSLYVKKKERELKELIMALSERTKESGGVKDEMIMDLQRLVKKARDNESKIDRQPSHRKNELGRVGQTAIASQEWLGENVTNGHHIARMSWGEWDKRPSHPKNGLGRLGQTAITLQE